MAQTEAEVARKTDTIMAQADKDGDGVVTFDGKTEPKEITAGKKKIKRRSIQFLTGMEKMAKYLDDTFLHSHHPPLRDAG